RGESRRTLGNRTGDRAAPFDEEGDLVSVQTSREGEPAEHTRRGRGGRRCPLGAASWRGCRPGGDLRTAWPDTRHHGPTHQPRVLRAGGPAGDPERCRRATVLPWPGRAARHRLAG